MIKSWTSNPMGVTIKLNGFGADRRLGRFNGVGCREVHSRILRKMLYLRVVGMQMLPLYAFASNGWILGFYDSGQTPKMSLKDLVGCIYIEVCFEWLSVVF